MQNNYYTGPDPVNDGERREVTNEFRQVYVSETQQPPMPVYPEQNVQYGPPAPVYQRQAVPVRRSPARQRPELTNGYMFSFGGSSWN